MRTHTETAEIIRDKQKRVNRDHLSGYLNFQPVSTDDPAETCIFCFPTVSVMRISRDREWCAGVSSGKGLNISSHLHWIHRSWLQQAKEKSQLSQAGVHDFLTWHDNRIYVRRKNARPWCNCVQNQAERVIPAQRTTVPWSRYSIRNSRYVVRVTSTQQEDGCGHHFSTAATCNKTVIQGGPWVTTRTIISAPSLHLEFPVLALEKLLWKW